MEANQKSRTRFSSALSSALEDVDAANKNLLSSIDRKCTSLSLDVNINLASIRDLVEFHSTEQHTCRFITT